MKIFFFSIFILFHLPIYSQEIVKSNPKPEEAKVSFSVGTRFGSVKGLFKKVNISAINEKAGSAIVIIAISSIDTGIQMRDKHLKSDDFFDIEHYPTAKFELLSLDTSSDPMRAKGALTIKAIREEYSFHINKEILSEDTEVYSGSFSINRNSFKLDYNSLVNPIEDTVKLDFSATIKYEISKQEKPIPPKGN
jgi:polyisoprenoid-binding protein YceI